MSIIEQATKRLEELRRGGVEVPWNAAGLTEERFDALVQQRAPVGRAATDSVPPAAPQGDEGRRDVGRVSRPLALDALTPPRTAPIVTLDLDRLANKGILVPSMARTALALEFRHIKRPLLRNADAAENDGRNKLVMITSALPAEGKTFCAVNLAMSMAMEVDTSVLLVDADVVQPAVLDRLGLPPAPGFLNVLTDPKLELGDVILRTNVPKLSILPAGKVSGMTTELLASGAMDRLLRELATRYPDRIVILDAPPLLATSEARVLASRVGQVVVVVDASSTTTNKVTEAFEAIAACPTVMSVLNKSTEASQGYGYGYGYA